MSEPFDFDAFINGTSLARRTVSAYRVDNRDAIARLGERLTALPADGGDERETSTTATERAALEAERDRLRAEMEASKVEWTLRTLTPEEYRDIPEHDDKPSDPPEVKKANAGKRFDVLLDMLALMSRAPEGAANPSLYRDLPQLTAEQWRKISVVLGVAQWGALVQQANELILSMVAVPDFSRSDSTTQPRRESSGN